MKTASKIIPAILLVGIASVVLIGCEDDYDYIVYYDYATIENQTPWDVWVEPYDILLMPGESVDIDLGPYIEHIVVVRDVDGLVLLETDIAAGDYWIIE